VSRLLLLALALAGILVGGPAHAGLELTASTTDEISFGDVAGFDDTASPLSFMFWFRHVGSVNLTDDVANLGKGGTGFYFYNASPSTPNGVATGVAGAWECRSAAANLLPPNTWVHVAFTWDGLLWRIYVNGVSITTAGTCTTNRADQGATSLSFVDNATANYIVAAFKAWSAGLSDAEVAAEAQLIRPSRTANLLLWNPLDDERLALDYSGQGRHGTLTGVVQRDSPPASWGGE
jgi:hypothetical protein